ncbi:ABC-type transport auxiliary lipoprotein family protein [Steroidobacter sp.]|uniref:ABC-type transport auxiliary lipoprotein family protein n=1 Tax=Steroidobacter sp. TaxID=1978227 RepID=UPI001A531E61|nr:ABC-type transport auxiliary lipoprotein family protein [Steroidobacter sp.]MBL8271459.1 membrane integrity-associated transporter subunit PqiC [Steroidobacter sp.]
MRTALLAAVALSCAACSTGSLFDSDTPVPTGYVIASAPAGSLSGVQATQVDISIARPDFAPGLDTDRIAVLKGRQLDYYRGARWGGRTVEVVQSMLVSTLQDQKLFRSVTAEQARVASDYMLDIEVRHFESDYARGAIPEAHVAIIGRLIRIVDRKLVATVTSDARVAATEERMSTVVAAFESASQKVALDLAQQTATAVATDQPALRKAHGETAEVRSQQ